MELSVKFSNNTCLIIRFKEFYMSTANETISKLSEALNTLIGAYEELQKENDKLNTQINDLTQVKEKIAREKELLSSEKKQALQELNDLQNDVNVLSDNSEQQNSSMYSMLDKIESLLGNESNEPTKEEVILDHQDDVFNDKQELEVESPILDIPQTEELKNSDNPTQDQNNKIDLNRMASLLNGFNK